MRFICPWSAVRDGKSDPEKGRKLKGRMLQTYGIQMWVSCRMCDQCHCTFWYEYLAECVTSFTVHSDMSILQKVWPVSLYILIWVSCRMCDQFHCTFWHEYLAGGVTSVTVHSVNRAWRYTYVRKTKKMHIFFSLCLLQLDYPLHVSSKQVHHQEVISVRTVYNISHSSHSSAHYF
jgi:hypothetical protein